MARSMRVREPSDGIRRYLVDEGGDGTLFASQGRVIIGTPGCSRFFMLAMLDVVDRASLQQAFDGLRTRLINDPYFSNVPSMQAGGRKTAIAFHAKDDLPEVRREVFSVLRGMNGLRFFAVVTDKWRVLEYVRQQNKYNAAYRFQPNELYDYLVRRLFKNMLHKDQGYEILFSRRGNSDRTEALRLAIETARQRFAEQWGVASAAVIQLRCCAPREDAGLQAIDYFTWALQRVYEKGEDRYLAYLWPAVHLVHDIDDTRKTQYGVYYTQKRPLNAATLEWRKEKARDIGLSGP